MEQKRLDPTALKQCDKKPERRTNEGESQALSNNQPENIRLLRSKGDADAQLVHPLRNAVTEPATSKDARAHRPETVGRRCLKREDSKTADGVNALHEEIS